MSEKIKRNVNEWLEAFAHAVVIVIILYFLAWPFTIKGSSMEDNFFTGDRIIICRVMVYAGAIDRGDVVVCEGSGTKDIIKRVVGLPGDQIEISDGHVYINGEVLVEPYVKEDYTNGSLSLTLGVDEYYLLGDNRSISQDSRNTGPFTRKQILGKTIAKWYPFNSLQFY